MRIHPVDKEFTKFSVIPTEDGMIYSQFGLGLPVLFIPFITFGKLVAMILDQPQEILVAFVLSFYNVPFALLGLWFFKGILLKLGRREKQANATLTLVAIGTAYWPYTVTDFSEITQVAFLLGSLHSVLLNDQRKWCYFSLWFALLTLVKLAFLILLPLFLAYALHENRKCFIGQIKSMLHSGIFLFPMGIALAYANYARFGNILESGYGANPGFGFGINYFLKTALPSIISLDYGIILFNPILLTFPLWRKTFQANKQFASFCIMLMAIWFCFMCSYSYGWGWGWGQRYIFALIPISMLCVSFLDLAKPTKTRTTLFSVIAASSCLIQLVASSTKFHEPLTMQIEAKEKFAGPYSPILPSTVSLFSHKLLDGSSNYPLSIIGGNPDEFINLSQYESFHGFNFWPVHALKFFGLHDYQRGLGLFLLAIITFLQFGLLRVHLPNLLSGKVSE